MKLWLLLAVCCVGLVLPASASAIKCAPPGNSEVDQYFATIPGSVCNFPATGPGGGGSHGSLPPGTQSQLSTQGPVGRAVARLVSANSANGSTGANNGRGGRSSRGGSGGAGAGGAGGLSGTGRGPVYGLFHPLSTKPSSGGVGVLLPILLIAALVLALGVIALRPMRRSSGSQP